jgi:N-acetylmuramoyl-L-alanine amidase
MVMLRKITLLMLAAVFAAAWTPAPVSAVIEQDLAGRVIILDAGHGSGNFNGWAGYIEHIAMFDLANRIKPLLEERGAVVHMARGSSRDVPLPVRSSRINRWALRELRTSLREELAHSDDPMAIQKEIDELTRLLRILESIITDPDKYAPVYQNTPFDMTYKQTIHPDWKKIFEAQDHPLIRENFLVISLHSNATGRPVNTSQNGANAFYASNSDPKNKNYYISYSNEHRSADFGRRLLNGIETLGIRNRGTQPNRYHMIREHNLPAVLVENGFHTNAQDRAKLSCGVFMEKLALVYADTISEYFRTYQEPMVKLAAHPASPPTLQ